LVRSLHITLHDTSHSHSQLFYDIHDCSLADSLLTSSAVRLPRAAPHTPAFAAGNTTYPQPTASGFSIISDMERSFSFLQDSIPQWLQAISTAEAKMAAMQAEVTKIATSPSPFAKKKTDSIESIRPGKLETLVEDTTSHGAQTDPLGKRKRRTTSALSGRASGPSRYRARTMVIVNYDGDMQKSFEELVRAIGTGRNLLRKAKMEAKMNELQALQESSDDTEEEDTKDETKDEQDFSSAEYRSPMSFMRARVAVRRSGRLRFSGGSNPMVEVYDKTDKTLEQAQELCEKAAHLTLRDGDCRKELDGARKNFETVLEIARNEVVKCNFRKSQDPPELVSHDTSDTSVSSIDTSDRDHLPQVTSLPVPQVLPKPTLSSAPDATPPPEPKIVDIEVDDEEEDEDEEFMMPPIRLTSRFGARG
jgi:hypothetical protein